MDYIHDCFELKAKKIINNLKKRHMEGYYVDSKEDALKLALELIKEDTSVSWGGSKTISELGLREALYSRGKNILLDRDKGDREQILREAFFADYYLTSVNAISENGVLVNVDRTGNRIAAISFGPKNIIAIVGRNKIVKDETSALIRARNIAAPINAQRFDIDTPCKKTGSCENCLAETCICHSLLFTRNSRNGRIKIILVNEVLGF